MDDLQRPPADGDRERVVARINRVHDEGRISTADRDIRLGNARSAQSLAELDLMTRDLDQLEATLPAQQPAAPAAGPYSTFDPEAGSTVADDAATAIIGARRRSLAVFLVVALVMVAVAALFVVGYRFTRSSDDNSSASPGTPASPASEPATPPDATPVDDPPAGPAYSLSAAGVRNFLDLYRKKFGTSRVVDLTLFGDYVVVDVPVPGKARQSGWLYRDGAWTDFGGVRATFPGSEVVDTNRLNIPALERNLARARRTLNVEQPQAYVIVRFIPQVDQVPSVDIHVTNKFQESGYLATTLDGKVERAYAYDR